MWTSRLSSARSAGAGNRKRLTSRRQRLPSPDVSIRCTPGTGERRERYQTLATWLDRYTAAWPAELPPPTVRGPSLEASMSRYLVDRITARPNVEILTETTVTALEGQDGILEAIRCRSQRSGEELRRAIRHLIFLHRRGAEYRMVVPVRRDA